MNAACSWSAPLRHEASFDAELLPYRVAADRVMLGLCVFLQLVCLAIAPVHRTAWAAIGVGGGTLALAAWLATTCAGSLVTRLYMGCAFMVYTALVIHQTGGSIEAHFTAFGLIAALLYYRDWRVIAAATIFIYVHHLVLGYAQLRGLSVYVFDTTEYWYKFGIHVAYFLPFVGLMGYLAIGLRREGHDNRSAIRLARDVAEGDFTTGCARADAPGADDTLLRSVQRMRDCVVDLLHSMPTAVMIVRVDERTVADVNDAWSRLFGMAAAQAVGAPVDALPIWADDAPWRACETQMTTRGASRPLIEMPMLRAGSGRFNAVLSAVEHRTERLHLLILSFEDVTLRREAERRMHQLAYQDMLTGLHNRAALMRHLGGLIEQRRGDRRSHGSAGDGLAVLLIDLDDFKPVNDRHGHEAGDRVLQAVARRIDDTRRELDFPARLGGDEFVVVLPECRRVDVAEHVAARLQGVLQQPIAVRDGVLCRVGATVGIAWYPPGELPTSVAAALDSADAALYEGKRAGKGALRLRSPGAGEAPAPDPVPDAPAARRA